MTVFMVVVGYIMLVGLAMSRHLMVVGTGCYYETLSHHDR